MTAIRRGCRLQFSPSLSNGMIICLASVTRMVSDALTAASLMAKTIFLLSTGAYQKNGSFFFKQSPCGAFSYIWYVFAGVGVATVGEFLFLPCFGLKLGFFAQITSGEKLCNGCQPSWPLLGGLGGGGGRGAGCFRVLGGTTKIYPFVDWW